jgi:hypothetical protein
MGRWGGHAELILECARERKSTGCPHANLEGGKGGGGGKKLVGAGFVAGLPRNVLRR